ncbi:MAG: ABC transporter ATP-binding protein [Coriobacteriales bacterium]|jgi:ABC-2 type transport system ATP-binding protein|nr:ABC transporter ATP-binding protein [Coriobacteriales bacterium]
MTEQTQAPQQLLEPQLPEPQLLPPQLPLPLAPVLHCQDLVKSYGSFPALGPVNLKLYPGRIVGLLGPNGSGKTTLLKTVAGLLTPSYGSVSVCGYQPGAQSKALVSFLPERTYLSSWMKVSDALDYFESFYADFSRQRAIEMLSSLQVPIVAHINKLSKGTKEKVQLILVMARRSKLYLLDEPIAGVDPAARDYIMNTIIANYDRSAASVISTHLISDVESVLDDYIFINRGQVVSAGPVSAVYEAGWPSLDAYFREAFRC